MAIVTVESLPRIDGPRVCVLVHHTVKRKSEQMPLGSLADDDRVKAQRHQTLAALYQVEHPSFY